MINSRTRPVSAARHVALIEMAVLEYAMWLWPRVQRLLLRWLRYVLAQLHDELRPITLEPRAEDAEIVRLAELIARISADYPQPEWNRIMRQLEQMHEEIVIQYGFLPEDPRTAILESEFRRVLKTNMLTYWKTLTNAKTLARRIAQARENNQTTAQIIRAVQSEYAASYYSAERLVRTLYNSGANRAQIETLRENGYTHKRWLTARDNRVRGGPKSRYDHRKMDGVVVPIDEPFTLPSGAQMLFPGDTSLGAPAGEIINCRCTIIGILLT